MDPNNPEGKERIRRLAENTAYFRAKLKQLGFVVIGDDHSPVVPLMIFIGAKLSAFVRLARSYGLAAVSVCFPATNLTGGRIRFCVSASHTLEMLDKVINI
ncbi:putative serine palmitoyltransferase-like protein, partial [Dinothrombium tinctorium]